MLIINSLVYTNSSVVALGVGHDDSKALNPRNNLEEEYLDYETKVS